MKRLRKTIAIAAAVLLVLLVLAVLALYLMLKTRLNEIISETVIPRAEALLGVDVTIDHAEMDLLRGSVSVDGLAIGNPQGFVEPNALSLHGCDIDIGILSLLRGSLTVSETQVKRGVLTISRNRDEKVNVTEIQRTIEAGTQGGAIPSTPRHTEPAPRDDGGRRAEPAKVLLRDFSLDTLVEYIDHELADVPVKLAFEARILADGIATFEREGSPWGTFTIDGHLQNAPEAFVTDLQGSLAPLVNPAMPSFDLNGKILAIDMTRLGDLTERLEVECDSADLAAAIKCRKGRYVEPDSRLAVTLHDPKPIGKLAKKTKGFPIPKRLTVTIPLSGELTSPDTDLEDALLRTLLLNFADNRGALLDELKVDDETAKEIGSALKILGDALLPKKKR